MKIKFIIVLFFLNSEGISQSTFPGFDTTLISKHNLKVKDLPKSLMAYGYDGFYKLIEDKQKPNNSKKFERYACCDMIYSQYDSLFNKVFTVIKIDPFVDELGNKKFRIELFEEKTSTIYFVYNPRFSHLWPFEILNLEQKPKDICDDIKINVDDYTKVQTYTSPRLKGISFKLIKNQNKATFYASVSQVSASAVKDKKGVIILLSDSTQRLKDNASIECNPLSFGTNICSSEFELTDDDIQCLLKYKIIGLRVFKFDSVIDDTTNEKLRDYFNCLSKISSKN